jgi:hypothetical protein
VDEAVGAIFFCGGRYTRALLDVLNTDIDFIMCLKFADDEGMGVFGGVGGGGVLDRSSVTSFEYRNRHIYSSYTSGN